MSFFLAFSCGDDEESPPVDGDDFASNSGTLAFMDWCATLDPDEYPELAPMGDEGPGGGMWCEDLPALESELERAIREKPGDMNDNVLHTLNHFLAGVRNAPEDARSLVVTDGTPGGGDEGDDE